MTIEPQAVRARVDAILAELGGLDLAAFGDGSAAPATIGTEATGIGAVDIDAVGRRLEEAHQILVDALESVEKG